MRRRRIKKKIWEDLRAFLWEKDLRLLLLLFFWFDDSNLHYTHAHTVWGGQRGFEPLPNEGEFSLAPLGQIPSGQRP